MLPHQTTPSITKDDPIITHSESSPPQPSPTTPTQRFRLEFQYDGTRYSGIQKQTTTPNTIQQLLEHCLHLMLNMKSPSPPLPPPELTVSSRTDRGVHACLNTAHVDMSLVNPHLMADEHKMKHVLNHMLGDESIRVLRIHPVGDAYDCKKNVRTRRYMYRILDGCGGGGQPLSTQVDQNMYPLEGMKLWMLRETLDVDRMREGLQYFVGSHSMTSFSSTSDPNRNKSKVIDPVKTIEEVSIESVYNCMLNRNEIRIFVQSKSFLKHQIRFMVQVIVKIGKLEVEPNRIEMLLKEERRDTDTKYMAPAHGLYLLNVIEKDIV